MKKRLAQFVFPLIHGNSEIEALSIWRKSSIFRNINIFKVPLFVYNNYNNNVPTTDDLSTKKNVVRAVRHTPNKNHTI